LFSVCINLIFQLECFWKIASRGQQSPDLGYAIEQEQRLLWHSIISFAFCSVAIPVLCFTQSRDCFFPDLTMIFYVTLTAIMHNRTTAKDVTAIRKSSCSKKMLQNAGNRCCILKSERTNINFCAARPQMVSRYSLRDSLKKK